MSKESNYYKDIGLSEVSSVNKITKAYNVFLKGNQKDEKQKAAFEVLTNPEKKAEHDAQPHMVEIREAINVKSLNALSGAKTMGKVSDGLAARMAALGETTESPKQQQSSNDRSPSPKAVVDIQDSPKQIKNKSPEVKQPSNATSKILKPKDKTQSGNVQIYSAEDDRKKKLIAAAQKRSGKQKKAPPKKQEAVTPTVTSEEELALEAKIKKTRGFKSAIKNMVNPSRLVGGLSNKEFAMKQALMKGSDVTNISQKDVKELSKTMVANNRKGQGYTR